MFSIDKYCWLPVQWLAKEKQKKWKKKKKEKIKNGGKEKERKNLVNFCCI